MNREIKFRAWNKNGEWHYFHVPQDIGQNVVGMGSKLGYSNWSEYTGLKDKNEVAEIYEGDVVKRDRSIGSVKFVYGEFVIDWKHNPQDWSDTIRYHNGDCEVIGNIYSNPELLK